ncbi:hypothetical protein GCK72_025852 [Caenorhabditis remanei]|uniref:SET domain-containing protein n=1 Tax=Caenorhabditis remanei TaxID=31234 RepID=A0A6A5G467_CAERE|nr:hypothetical protein GCK72_025852 [Caenorhabditis remanei]KAF1749384.1 hypothetical protein GCK72_025852 [Caenorhabditis remanei]
MAPPITRAEKLRLARVNTERTPTQHAQQDRARPSTQAQRPARPSFPPRGRSVQSSTHHRGDSTGRGDTSSRGRSQQTTSSRDNAPRPPSTTPYRRAQSRVRFDTSPRRHSQRSPSARDNRRRSPSARDNRRRSPSPVPYRRNQSRVRFDISPRRDGQRSSPARDNRRRSPSPVQYRRYPSRAGRLSTQSPDRQSRHSPDRNRRQYPPCRGDVTDSSGRSRNVSPARRSPSSKRSRTQPSTATQSSRQAHGRDVCSSDRNRSISMSLDENRTPQATTSSSIRAGPPSPLQGTSSVSLSPDGRQPRSPISQRTRAQTRTRGSSRNRSISMSPLRHRTPSPVRKIVLPVRATPTSPARPSTSSGARSSCQNRYFLTFPVRRGASSSIGRQTRSQVRASAPPRCSTGPSTSSRGRSTRQSSSPSPIGRRTRSALRSPARPRYSRAQSVPAPKGPNRKWIAVDMVLKKVVVSPEKFLEGSRFEKLKELSDYQYRRFGRQIEKDQFDETKDMYCEECDAYFRPSCKEHPVHRIEDAIVTLPLPRNRTNAEMTIPARYMYIANSRIPNAGKGVFAKELIPVGFLLGPYGGKKFNHRRDLESDFYAFMVETSPTTHFYRDATDPDHSNWTRFVNAPNSDEEQNLVALQINEEIFFRVVKAIEPHEELFVPYGKSFRI